MNERKPEHSIFTVTGQRVWPLEPRVEDFNIVDIAHSLANQCRFTGHTNEFYSVAQHSVLVSRILSPEHQLWGLLHDATEAYLIDLAKPVKIQMPEYRKVEDRLMEVLALRFNLSWPMPEEVHMADRVMLVTEKRDLMPRSGSHPSFKDIVPLEYTITPWTPQQAKESFLRMYRYLTGDIPASLDVGVCGIDEGSSCSTGRCGSRNIELETYAIKTIAKNIADTPVI